MTTPVGPVRQREVARDRAQRQAEAVERGGRQAVAAVERLGPDRLVVEPRHRASLDRGQRLVDRDDARAGDDALDRDAVEVLAQMLRAARPRYGRAARSRCARPRSRRRDSRRAWRSTPGDAQAGAGAAHGDHAAVGQRSVGSAQVDEVAVRHLRDGMADRAEIVDQRPAVDASAARRSARGG